MNSTIFTFSSLLFVLHAYVCLLVVPRQEYKEAISKGHGAFLMEESEERSDIWSISVGNVPPLARVLVKITYITELRVSGADQVVLRLPAFGGCSSESAQEVVRRDITQQDTRTVMAKDTAPSPNTNNQSVVVHVEMPFKILNITSSSHPNAIRCKRSHRKALVELKENEHLEDEFTLLIAVKDVDIPRMWVERSADETESNGKIVSVRTRERLILPTVY